MQAGSNVLIDSTRASISPAPHRGFAALHCSSVHASCPRHVEPKPTTPISLDFGWDRGTPIGRYYIESFLADRTADISGRVLEIGDDAYSRRYGGSQITKQDVLHLDVNHPIASLVGDLTQPDVLPDGAFDCILLTQTLQLIFDLEQAVRRLHAALRPGGVLLFTVPGISQIDRGQ